MKAFKEVYSHAERLEMRSEKLLAKQDLLIQYIASFSRE
jgi:hypothetical protein